MNPYAGRWTGRAALPKIEETLRRLGYPFELAITNGPDHAIILARAAMEAGYSPIVAVGGDGTISEVINGLMEAAAGDVSGPLGIIPAGCANDFARQLGLPRDVAAACRRLFAGHERVIDVGLVNGRYFVNDVGVGFEPQVTLEARQIQWLRGTLVYLVAVFRALRHLRQPHMTIEWDGGRASHPMPLISVGNGNMTGGFRLTPHARLDDGALDFVFAQRVTLLQILRLLPSTLRGTHIHHPLVVTGRATRIAVHSEEPVPVGIDGEVRATKVQDLNFTVLPAQLRVLC
jgi:diacylglycerol kinase (ATP)